MPAENWTGVFNATQNGNVCMQWKNNAAVGSEDCLFIYVYTPYVQYYPVLAFIPGGGFSSGGPLYENFPPGRFMDHDVVLVVIGHRLGAFGNPFGPSLNDSASYGNYGLLDQVEAFKWIQTNIGAFGGDKLKVTIYGQSAGAASVNFHQVSNVSLII